MRPVRPGGPRRRGPAEGEVTVFVADEQSAHPVDLARWQALARDVLADEGVVGDVEVTVIFADEATMAELNRLHLDGEGPTDVLSFPIDGEVVSAGRAPDGGTAGPQRQVPPVGELPLLLGDVVICPAVAHRNAPDHAGSADDELALLVVHGLLHLLGHDHAEPGERQRMHDRERHLLAAHWGTLAGDPWSVVEADGAGPTARHPADGGR